MSKLILSCLIALLGAGAAQAQERAVRGILGLGVTGGGDTLVTVPFNNGTTEDITGGGLVHAYGGIELRVAPQLTLQGTIGYHVNSTSSASNGGLRFSRYPIELLGHFQIGPQFRLGGGARLVDSAKIRGSGVLSGFQVDFQSTTGLVVEGEYLVSPQFGLKLRAVSEKYTPTTGGPSADGNHVGLYFNWYL
jgi:hypothetical protein